MTALFNYPHIVVLAIWGIIAMLALLRYFSVSICARISWKWLLVVSVALSLLYGALLSWDQYARWHATDTGRVLTTAPLSKEVPLPELFEWVRPVLEREGGYFVFYVFGHFFLSTIILFLITGSFVFLLKLRKYYRPNNFAKNDVMAIAVAFLISGWPGVIVLIPLGFLCALIVSVVLRITLGIERIYLPPAFLVAAPFALVFGVVILKSLHLYTLLKL